MTDVLESATAETNAFAGVNADELHILRRKHTADYLKAREACEDATDDLDAWSLRQTWAITLVDLLVATGDYPTVDEAADAIQMLTFPQAAERFVELWMSREDLWGALPWEQSSVLVCAVADLVRDWVADGGELGQMPMREWTAPYLEGHR